jgi:hypothetical protein
MFLPAPCRRSHVPDSGPLRGACRLDPSCVTISRELGINELVASGFSRKAACRWLYSAAPRSAACVNAASLTVADGFVSMGTRLTPSSPPGGGKPGSRPSTFLSRRGGPARRSIHVSGPDDPRFARRIRPVEGRPWLNARAFVRSLSVKPPAQQRPPREPNVPGLGALLAAMAKLRKQPIHVMK